MKIIVELEYNIDTDLLGCKTYEEYYNKYYNNNGILFDEDVESIYYEVEVPFIPVEGQRVGTKFGTCIVTYSYLELGDITDSFFYRSRIVVSEE